MTGSAGERWEGVRGREKYLVEAGGLRLEVQGRQCAARTPRLFDKMEGGGKRVRVESKNHRKSGRGW